MKQKKIGNKLYVFDLEPYVITNDTDAEVVYVQNHVYDAYKTLNPSLNIKRYNYNVMGVSQPEWYEYIDAAEENNGNENPIIDPVDPNQSPITLPTLSFSPGGGTVPINGDPSNVSIPVGTMLSNPDNIPVTFTITEGYIYAYLDMENNLHPNQSLANTAGNYTVVVTASYSGDPSTYGNNAIYATSTWTFIISGSGNSETPVHPIFTPITYSFESFSSSDHSTKYGTGKVVTMEGTPVIGGQQVTGYVAVQVTENSFDANLETPFVGRIFLISESAKPGDGMYWNLTEYIIDNQTLEHTDIDVKVYYENMIPSEATPSE